MKTLCLYYKAVSPHLTLGSPHPIHHTAPLTRQPLQHTLGSCTVVLCLHSQQLQTGGTLLGLVSKHRTSPGDPLQFRGLIWLHRWYS